MSLQDILYNILAGSLDLVCLLNTVSKTQIISQFPFVLPHSHYYKVSPDR